MLRPLMHGRHHWSREEREAALIAAVVVLFALVIAALLWSGRGVV